MAAMDYGQLQSKRDAERHAERMKRAKDAVQLARSMPDGSRVAYTVSQNSDTLEDL